MVRRTCWVLLAMTLAAVGVGAQAPPVTVLDHLQAAVNPEEGPFAGTWRMITSSVVEKPNGRARHEATMEMRCSRDEGGELHREVIHFVRDGTDRTDTIRERLRKEDTKHHSRRKEEAHKKENEAEADFVPPDLEHRDLYVFEPLPTKGGTKRSSFRPAPGHEKDRGLLAGELAWDPLTLDPLWIEGEVLRPPRPLKKMHLRLEFRRTGHLLYISRVTTSGLARVLFLKRRFHADVRFEDLEPVERPDGD